MSVLNGRIGRQLLDVWRNRCATSSKQIIVPLLEKKIVVDGVPEKCGSHFSAVPGVNQEGLSLSLSVMKFARSVFPRGHLPSAKPSCSRQQRTTTAGWPSREYIILMTRHDCHIWWDHYPSTSYVATFTPSPIVPGPRQVLAVRMCDTWSPLFVSNFT